MRCVRFGQGWLALGVGALAACADTAPARTQLLVLIDTDAHVVGELSAAANVSPDATIDTLRIDLSDATGQVYASHLLFVSSPSSWPISFGIQPPATASGEVSVRVRAFRSVFATAGTVIGDQSTLDPPTEVTIDRLVALSFPSGGVGTAAILLAQDCMGAPVGFGAKRTTCIDAANRADDPHAGVAASAGSSSRVGTWSAALDVPCTASIPSDPSANAKCVPGGFAILGDSLAVGVAGEDPAHEPVPLRPAVVRPFYLDQTEFTVGRLRALVQSGYTGPLPVQKDDPNLTDSGYCTWLGASDATNDEKPVNCIHGGTADSICMAKGERLPTEVEWEFEARGRGRRYQYPWGSTYARCCTASLGRSGPVTATDCQPAAGIENVGSHPPSACGGVGDVSIDGIVDMGGSVIEVVSTGFAPYSDPCWSSVGIVRTPPACVYSGIPAARGSYWNSGLASPYGTRRGELTTNAATGFRCASDGS